MELISKEEVIKITKKYDTTIYDAAMWCRKEIEELKTYTPLGSVLDKIREEIVDTGAYEQEVNGKTEFLEGISYCLDVIDKYGAESEEGARQ